MIIPSAQTLLITSNQQKTLYQFDPKTACVLHTYSTESDLASTAAYYEIGQQFMIPHLNNTYVNVWEADVQEPRKFTVGDADKVLALAKLHANSVIMGTAKGTGLLYELPSGILVRKVQLHTHSSQIINLIPLRQIGYIISCTKKQIRLFPLHQLLSQAKSMAQHTITSALPILSTQLILNILCVVTQKTVSFYHAYNFALFSLNKDLPTFSNITCSCSSSRTLFVGEGTGKIREIVIDAHEKELGFEERKGRLGLVDLKPRQIQTKDPVTALAFVESLQFLISGNSKGQVKIWSGQTLKNSVQLFKSPINLLFTISRPHKQKIPQSHKIRSFHKQQQSKTDQPIIFDSGTVTRETDIVNISQQQKESQESLCLDRMLQYLNDPKQLFQTEIEELRNENRLLTEANLGYYNMFESGADDQYEQKSVDKVYN